jgi:hypothetical protein
VQGCLRDAGLGGDHPEGAALGLEEAGVLDLVCRLIAQIQRILGISHLSVVTKEVVEAARESLVIGVM